MNKLPDFLQELYYFLRGQNPKLGIMDVYKFFIWLEETTLPCYSLLLLFILMSCFITLLLSATRMISTVQPFLRMKQKFILLAVITAAFLFVALFGAKLLVLACLSEFNSSPTPDLGKMATCAEKHEPIEWYSLRIEWGLISSHVILVCIFNVVTILKLRSGDEAVHQADTAKRKRAATITVLILGLLFIVFNALFEHVHHVVIATAIQCQPQLGEFVITACCEIGLRKKNEFQIGMWRGRLQRSEQADAIL